MKKFFKCALALTVCVVVAAVCAFFSGCGTDFKSFYNDVTEIWKRNGKADVDYTCDDYNETLLDGIEKKPVTSVVSCKGFSGVKTINKIKIEPGLASSVCTLEFTEFRMSQGKLKVYLTRTESAWDVFSTALTPAFDQILCYATIYGETNYTEEADKEYFDKHFKGEWAVKIVGVDADFDFELQFITEENVNGPEKPPVDPPEPSSSDFEKIKAAYENVGYTVDLGSDDVDESMQALINQTKELYSKLGYNLCYIGKNLDNALKTELYMLIATDSAANTEKIAEAYDGMYRYAENGRDIIVSIWPMGTPNFAPFNQATA